MKCRLFRKAGSLFLFHDSGGTQTKTYVIEHLMRVAVVGLAHGSKNEHPMNQEAEWLGLFEILKQTSYKNDISHEGAHQGSKDFTQKFLPS